MKKASAILALCLGGILSPTVGAALTPLDDLQVALSACTNHSLSPEDWPDALTNWTPHSQVTEDTIDTYTATSVIWNSMRDINGRSEFYPIDKIARTLDAKIAEHRGWKHLHMRDSDGHVLSSPSGWTLIAITDYEGGPDVHCTFWHDDPDAQVIDFIRRPYLGIPMANGPLGEMSYVRIARDGNFRDRQHLHLESFILDTDSIESVPTEHKNPLAVLPKLFLRTYYP